MRRPGRLTFAALFPGLALLSVAVVAASVAGNATEEDLKSAEAYKPLAEALGAGTLAHATVSQDPKQVTYEFLPAGELLGSWTRMVTVQVAATSDSEAVNRAIDAMREVVRQVGIPESFDVSTGARKRPAASFCYRIPGKAIEYTCGIVGEFSAGAVTVFQLQRRGTAIGDKEKARLKSILLAYF